MSNLIFFKEEKEREREKKTFHILSETSSIRWLEDSNTTTTTITTTTKNLKRLD